jgi:hypothetical protein
MNPENSIAIIASRRTRTMGGSHLKAGIIYKGRLNIWRKTVKIM